jgi:hypothetical protein
MPLNAKSKTKEKSITIIDTDVPRTFSHIEGLDSQKKLQLTAIL